MPTTLLEIDKLVVGYHRKPLLPPVSFKIQQGQVWGIIGPNGSGKSTLLKTVLGLQSPISGALNPHPALRIGYVPQRTSFDLAVPSRVKDVVQSGLDRGWSFLDPLFVRKHRADIEQAMVDTHVENLAGQQFVTLSEGQKQRVMVARALVSQPNLIVLDEPTSAMDATAERKMFELLAELRQGRDLGVMLVSHHLPVVGEFATHAVYVDRDNQVVEPGDIKTVCECSHCVARYGHVLKLKRHG
jgi:zinc transport system ATP-binding protein